MTVSRFLLYLFVFIGLLAASSVVVLLIGLMLRFPPLLLIAVLAGGSFAYILKLTSPS